MSQKIPPTKNKDTNDLEALLKQCSCHNNTLRHPYFSL